MSNLKLSPHINNRPAPQIFGQYRSFRVLPSDTSSKGLNIFCDKYTLMTDIELAVKGVFVVEANKKMTPFVLLDDGNGRFLPIDVGYSQAMSIDTVLQNKIPARPLTHDLMIDIISGLDATIHSTIIDDIIEGVYYARLIITIGSTQKEFDARPSDCVALAVRTKTPIYIDEALLKLASIGIEGLEGMKTLDELGQ